MLRPFTDTNFGVKSVTVKFNINKQPVAGQRQSTWQPTSQLASPLKVRCLAVHLSSSSTGWLEHEAIRLHDRGFEAPRI